MRGSRSGKISLIADDNTEYSDSMVDVAMSPFSLEDYVTGPFAMQIA
jgi:hypothetical protein